MNPNQSAFDFDVPLVRESIEITDKELVDEYIKK